MDRPKPKARKHVIGVRVTDDIHSFLKEKAKRNKVTLSFLAESMILIGVSHSKRNTIID